MVDDIYNTRGNMLNKIDVNPYGFYLVKHQVLAYFDNQVFLDIYTNTSPKAVLSIFSKYVLSRYTYIIVLDMLR